MTDPDIAEKLAGLRNEMSKRGLDAFVLPSTDEFLNEFVPPHNRRLEWLTGFTGSAGTAVVTEEFAAFFTDGRYTLQAQQEVDGDLFERHDLFEKSPISWVNEVLKDGRRIGYDPHLQSVQSVAVMETLLEEANKVACPTEPNPIDVLWRDRPAAPFKPLQIQEMRFAGESTHAKRRRLCNKMAAEGIDALLLTAPDSICWLLNIRGQDVPHTPVVLTTAIVERSDHEEGHITLLLDARRVDGELERHLGEGVQLRKPEDASDLLHDLERDGKHVLLDPHFTPAWFAQKLEAIDCPLSYESDPCQMMKACKNPAEIAGTIEAHKRDGAALTQFLCWLDENAPSGEVTELSATQKLYECRSRQQHFVDTSFETIAGFGANGAIVHYRSTERSNRILKGPGLFLLDSGGQYYDGTTDVTRTIAIGQPDEEQKRRFTQVLKGHIALASATFPEGTTGGQLDVLARYALWQEGCDYDHGTGHGVGSFLSVHEGPQRISKKGSDVSLKPGMILSNEPGYYQTGEYGIRIENLVRVVGKPDLSGKKLFLGFETLTMAPIDMRLVDRSLLDDEEQDWLEEYHRKIIQDLQPLLSEKEQNWLHTLTGIAA